MIESGHNVQEAILQSEKQEPFRYDSVQVIPLPQGLASLTVLLKNESFDVCHFQEYSDNGIDIMWFREARKYCNKLFFTFHLPYLTCYKNDFRYKGIEDCNNFSSPERCIQCIIATRLNYKSQDHFNLYNWLINIASPLIEADSKFEKIKKNIQQRKNDLLELIQTCDEVFIYGAWFKRILFDNGYRSPNLKMIPHITKINFTRNKKTEIIQNRILFVGRIEKIKGLHLLSQAMRLITTKQIKLDVAGNIVDENYFNSCREKFPFDYKGALPRTELLRSFSQYDFLILPSAFTEMYSLVLREAFYEELPAIVSTAKGNKDVVKEGVNGFLFEYNNSRDLALTIDKAYALKREGWKPTFLDPGDPEKDIEEIVSYYV